MRFAARDTSLKTNFSSSLGLHTCNGFLNYARVLTNVFEKLTGIADLRSLSMLPWAPIFNPMGHGLLSKTKRWCPLCLRRQHEETGIMSEPLLWHIKSVAICPSHHIPLESKCSHCRSQQVLFASHASVGFCSKCNRPLTESALIKLRDMKSKPKDTPYRDEWLANAICEMIAASNKLPSEFSALYLSDAIRNLLKGNIFRSKAQMCRKLKINLHTLNQWQSGRHLASFDFFLDFCLRVNLSPVALILLNQQMPPTFNNHPPVASRARKHLYNNSFKDTIEKALKRHVTEDTPLPLKRIAEMHKCGVTFLRLNWPSLSAQILARFKKHRQQKSNEKAKAAMNGTVKAFKSIKAKGDISSKRLIFKELINLKEKHYGNNQKTYDLIRCVQSHAGFPPKMEA